MKRKTKNHTNISPILYKHPVSHSSINIWRISQCVYSSSFLSSFFCTLCLPFFLLLLPIHSLSFCSSYWCTDIKLLFLFLSIVLQGCSLNFWGYFCGFYIFWILRKLGIWKTMSLGFGEGLVDRPNRVHPRCYNTWNRAQNIHTGWWRKSKTEQAP